MSYWYLAGLLIYSICICSLGFLLGNIQGKEKTKFSRCGKTINEKEIIRYRPELLNRDFHLLYQQDDGCGFFLCLAEEMISRQYYSFLLYESPSEYFFLVKNNKRVHAIPTPPVAL